MTPTLTARAREVMVYALLIGILLVAAFRSSAAQNNNSPRVWTKPAGSVSFGCGTKTATTTPAELAATQATSEVTVQCDPDAAVDCFVGSSSAQPLQLKAGQSFNVPVSNLTKLYVATASSTALVNFCWRN